METPDFRPEPDAAAGPDRLRGELGALRRSRPLGRVAAVAQGVVEVSGLGRHLRLGDRLSLRPPGAPPVPCEALRIGAGVVVALPEEGLGAVRVGDPVRWEGAPRATPHEGWIGRILDPDGAPLDGRPLLPGPEARPLLAPPPPAATRRRLGARLATGLAVTDTLLPLARGQRVGLFAGSGVGKSSLLADLARGVEADVVVVALVGERGRELREFTEGTLGAEGMARAVVVAATSDRAPAVRRRCAWTAMAAAEHFRDRGAHVLLLVDSVTRFAEAAREVALAAGEAPSHRGFPPSVAAAVAALAERAGPGPERGPEGARGGDVTAVFSVLVAGSDMEEPVADTLRGVLDGHVVLERAIAERGRFPAVDAPRSVSRSLPGVASEAENALLARLRRLLGAYDRSELMVRSGLYTPGSDALLDEAVRLHPALDAFLAERSEAPEAAFARLEAILGGRG